MKSDTNSSFDSMLRTVDELNLSSSDDELTQSQLSLAGHATGLYLSGLEGFSGFNPDLPESASQGVFESIYEVQEMCCSMTGLDAASLSALTSFQAVFASLSMIKKYHQRKKQVRSKLLLCADLPEVIDAAGQVSLDIKVISIRQLEESLDSRVAAIILPMPIPGEDGLLNDSLRARLREMDVLIYMNSCAQYFIPALISAVDLISLDLGHQCETAPGAYAVMSTESLQPYLPVTHVQQVDNRYRLQTHLHNPPSIGALTTSAGNIEAILRCYVQLRLKGVTGILQQALRALVSSLYVIKKLTDSGFENACDLPPSSGQCRITLNYSASSVLSLQKDLESYIATGLRIDDFVLKDEDSFTVTLGRMHYLSKKQLDSLVELILTTRNKYGL